MSDQPLDLAALADVDSPEVIRAALKTFRRRTLSGSLWVIAVVAALAIPAIVYREPPKLSERIASAKVAVNPGIVESERGVTAVVMRVADLGRYTGIHLIVVSTRPQQTTFEVHLENDVCCNPYQADLLPGSAFDGWYQVAVPSDGRITVHVTVFPGCTPPPGFVGCYAAGPVSPTDQPVRTFEFDLKAAGVPAGLWQKGEPR
jgi:hypothetical protein